MTDIIKYENLELDKICHICLVRQENLQLVSKDISDMLIECASVQDFLDHQFLICENCQDEVIKWYAFKQQVHTSLQICKEVLEDSSNVVVVPNELSCEIKEENSNSEEDSISEEIITIQINDDPIDSVKTATNCSDTKPLNFHPRTGKTYPCDKCDASFTIHHQLRTHALTHGHKCETCAATFSSYNRLWRHRRKECQQTHFACPDCPKIYNFKYSLESHIEHCHSKRDPDLLKRFVCNVCGKQYTALPSLKVHMRVHTGERPFICEYCSKGFIVKKHLINHVRIHTGERPYKCQDCDKCFLSSSLLGVHRRSHTGERPYKCQLCPKDFGLYASFRKHLRSH